MSKSQKLIIAAGQLALVLADCPEITPEEADAIKLTAALMEHYYGMPEGFMRYTEPPCYPDGIDRTFVEHICKACYGLGKR